MEAGLYNVRVDLFEAVDAFAFGEEKKRWVAFEEFIWRIRRRGDMESGGRNMHRYRSWGEEHSCVFGGLSLSHSEI